VGEFRVRLCHWYVRCCRQIFMQGGLHQRPRHLRAVERPHRDQAVKGVFQERSWGIAVSSLKSMLGHLWGVAGAVEAIATILTIKEGVIPPSTMRPPTHGVIWTTSPTRRERPRSGWRCPTPLASAGLSPALPSADTSHSAGQIVIRPNSWLNRCLV
jgi:hypothetical protein